MSESIPDPRSARNARARGCLLLLGAAGLATTLLCSGVLYWLVGPTGQVGTDLVLGPDVQGFARATDLADDDGMRAFLAHNAWASIKESEAQTADPLTPAEFARASQVFRTVAPQDLTIAVRQEGISGALNVRAWGGLMRLGAWYVDRFLVDADQTRDAQGRPLYGSDGDMWVGTLGATVVAATTADEVSRRLDAQEEDHTPPQDLLHLADRLAAASDVHFVARASLLRGWSFLSDGTSNDVYGLSIDVVDDDRIDVVIEASCAAPDHTACVEGLDELGALVDAVRHPGVEVVRTATPGDKGTRIRWTVNGAWAWLTDVALSELNTDPRPEGKRRLPAPPIDPAPDNR